MSTVHTHAKADDPIPTPPSPPAPIPATVMYLIATITAVAALLLGQNLIDNRIEKLVEGFAAIVIPAAWVLGNALYHIAHQTHVAGVATARALRSTRP